MLSGVVCLITAFIKYDLHIMVINVSRWYLIVYIIVKNDKCKLDTYKVKRDLYILRQDRSLGLCRERGCCSCQVANNRVKKCNERYLRGMVI